MKPKAKTLIEKQGFLDPDRSLPLHDEIQLWTYNNIVEVLNQFTTGAKTFEITYKQLEYPILQTSPNFKNIVGFVDLFVAGKVTTADGTKTKDFAASIEIKSVIPSCGDLIRQINFYKKFEQWRSTWIVVSPDDKFDSVLLEQNIYFFRYPGIAATSTK